MQGRKELQKWKYVSFFTNLFQFYVRSTSLAVFLIKKSHKSESDKNNFAHAWNGPWMIIINR